MAPARTKKSKESKENADQQKRVLASKEKILSIKRTILSIVEAMLEKELPKEWFLKNCLKLCHADYDDVVQERSIDHLCGYPMCSNEIAQIIKQKYHISRVSNKVYDLTDRKNFCGNLCYKASQYLKAQLSPMPLYMRKEENFDIHLLSDHENRGSAGEEILFHHTLPKEEIEKVCTVEQTSSNLVDILNNEIKDCAESISELKIKEHVFEKPFVFKHQTNKHKGNTPDKEKESSESSELDSDESDNEKLFYDDNLSILSHTHMPVPKKSIKSQLICPLKPHSTINVPVQQLSLDFIYGVFKDWMTEDTMKYLLGEKYVYGLKADHLFEKMTASDPIDPDKLSSIKNDYINLCLKIDSLPDDDLSDSSELDFLGVIAAETRGSGATVAGPDGATVAGPDGTTVAGPDGDTVGPDGATVAGPDGAMVAGPDGATVAGPDKSSVKKTFKKRPQNDSKSTDKRVTFASDLNNVSEKKTMTNNCAEEKVISNTLTVEKDINAIDGSTLVGGSDNINVSTSVEGQSVSGIEASTGNKTTSNKKRTSKVGVKVKRKQSSNVEGNSDLLDDATAEQSSPSNSSREGFPLVDSVSQNSLRRQLLIHNFKSAYNDILPVIGLHHTDIRQGVKKFVETLSLTPSNIMYKPKEWKLISIILLRILTRTVLKDIDGKDQFLKFYEGPVIPAKVNVEDIEKLVCDILSPETILALPKIIE